MDERGWKIVRLSEV